MILILTEVRWFFFQGELIFLFIISINLHNLRIVSGFFLLNNDNNFNKQHTMYIIVESWMYFGREEENVRNKSASSHCSKQHTMYIMVESWMYFGREEKNVPNKSASSHCSKQQTMYIMLESSMYSERAEKIFRFICVFRSSIL